MAASHLHPQRQQRKGRHSDWAVSLSKEQLASLVERGGGVAEDDDPIAVLDALIWPSKFDTPFPWA